MIRWALAVAGAALGVFVWACCVAAGWEERWMEESEAYREADGEYPVEGDE